jgi:hypothetical protein
VTLSDQDVARIADAVADRLVQADRFLTIREAAALVQMSPDAVYRDPAAYGGFKVGQGRGRWRFTRAGILAAVGAPQPDAESAGPCHDSKGPDASRAAEPRGSTRSPSRRPTVAGPLTGHNAPAIPLIRPRRGA